MKSRYMYVASVVCVSIALLAQSQAQVFAAWYGMSYTNDKEYVQAVWRMRDNEMTQYWDAERFRPWDYVTREQAAKFFVGYVDAFLSGWTTQDGDCDFGDINKADATLQASIEEACRIGLFYGADGYFLPTQALTKAQAITVLIRALEKKYDETSTPRWSMYFERARVLGITKETNAWRLDAPLTRYEMALLLARSQGLEAPEWSWEVTDQPGNGVSATKSDLDELREILLQLGLRTE